MTATDANGDKLTYTIGGVATPPNIFDHDGDPDTPEIPRFTIDSATGQLMVGDNVKLNYEDINSYVVMVIATDSSGNTTEPATTTPPEATVTINVIDVDEKPTFSLGSPAAGVVAAQTEGMTDIDTGTTTDVEPATLEASDPEGERVTLSLMGNDAGSFELAGDTDTGNDVSQILSFKEKTDYEMPGDRNRDNVYEVTVRVSDGTMNADRALIIKVINDDTEGGMVTVTPADAVVGVELTATLAHTDGGVVASGQITEPMWQWQTAAAPTNDGDTCAADDSQYDTPITDVTEATYTPVSANEGLCLRANVTYYYQFAAEPISASSAGTEVLASQANQAPKFKEGTSTFRVVAESVAALNSDDEPADDSDDADTDDNVGSPLVATDANGDMPTYTLGGAGASLFRIRSNGQIEVKGKLDHEKSSSHTVTLTANDGSGSSNDSARITVTIHVTDVDEPPTIKDRADSRAEGTRTVKYKENSAGPVARFTATDPEGARPIVWSLPGAGVIDTVVDGPDVADQALFEIDQNGVLSFKTPRSHEDESATSDENYRVVVQASDGSNNGYFKVTVNVTDVEETGKITWTVAPPGVNAIVGLQQFQPGAVLVPTVTDPDSVTGTEATGLVPNGSVTKWKWYRGSAEISGEILGTYTVVADDVGQRIRVDATYPDGNGGPEGTVRFTSENPVQAVRPSTDNTGPAFNPAIVTRRVEENSKGNVGGPVTATDGNTGDKLTYSLSGNDVASFEIDKATGQLTVGDDTEIDYEVNDSYTVEVTATDSSGAPTTTAATVTINVINVGEKPAFGDVDDAGGMNRMRAMVGENVTGTGLDVATYTATDPEGEDVSLSLMGDDASLFELNDPDSGDGKVLSFKKSPDFEMPGDRNDDNLYEVTVRASTERSIARRSGSSSPPSIARSTATSTTTCRRRS